MTLSWEIFWAIIAFISFLFTLVSVHVFRRRSHRIPYENWFCHSLHDCLGHPKSVVTLRPTKQSRTNHDLSSSKSNITCCDHHHHEEADLVANIMGTITNVCCFKHTTNAMLSSLLVRFYHFIVTAMSLFHRVVLWFPLRWSQLLCLLFMGTVILYLDAGVETFFDGSAQASSMSVMVSFHSDVNLAIYCQFSIDSGALPSETLQEVLPKNQLRLVAIRPRNWCLGRRIWDPGILWIRRCDELVQEKMKINRFNHPLASLIKKESIVINRRCARRFKRLCMNRRFLSMGDTFFHRYLFRSMVFLRMVTLSVFVLTPATNIHHFHVKWISDSKAEANPSHGMVIPLVDEKGTVLRESQVYIPCLIRSSVVKVFYGEVAEAYPESSQI
ncbi:hypothetical protein ISN45_Aa03g024050 [Arabidopsis thaliana x Arabidopsis arenosa]|uniref:Transmembrane protein n=1 Tax=Arabidopsis thaliana x Arabidopsis arenosa TaxID=1240361 RepID=A0A8T2AZK1_9BRAS|nr:hypothetical protein ISN45_Aa03g024050 [Arabidopsis thaliana x Arabidopsis arenosa]